MTVMVPPGMEFYERLVSQAGGRGKGGRAAESDRNRKTWRASRGSADKKRVFFLRVGRTTARCAAQFLDGGKRRLQPVEKSESPARGSEERGNGGQDLLGPPAEIGKHAIRALNLH